MKRFLVLSLAVLPSLVMAQVNTQSGATYREFQASIALCSGETKAVTLQVNPELRVDRNGDPEIPNHGFHDYVVTGSILENGKSCAFEALLTQADGKAMNTRQILDMNTDRPHGIRLCSGLLLSTSSLRSLLVGTNSKSELRAYGIEKALGTGEIRFSGIKTIQEDESCIDRWNCRP